MKIGELKEVLFDGEPGFEGFVRTLDLDLSIQLQPNNDKQTDQSPDLYVLTKSRMGHWVQVGNAWKKLPKRTGVAGEEFISITIDDPGFEKAINVAAFHQIDKSWDVTWRRRQDRPDPEAA